MSGKTIRRWKMGAGGFIGEVSLLELREGVVELSNLHVHPLRRGKGWSRVLVQTALDYADEQGWRVWLRITPYNNPTLDEHALRRFYAGFGFKLVRKASSLHMEMIR